MSAPREPKRVPHLGTFRLDGWSVRQDEGTLCCEDRVVRLEPRVMDVLVYLTADPGAVVSKEDLLEVVWGGSFVEEGVLAQAIHSLRKALGDDARQPRFIQTIPKRGYRLVASVELEVSPYTFPAVKPPARWRARLLLGVALLSLVVVLGFVPEHVLERISPPTPRPPANRWIVVLPFENLNEPQDAYFAKALNKEIIDDLASVAALHVISQTSAVHYGGDRRPASVIGRELKVDYVLEGTVAWNVGLNGAPQVHITPRLVRVADDAQVWVDGFDREVKDIFAVQSVISRRVIAHLDVELSPEEKEKQNFRLSPTANLEAYQAYLRGLELKNQPDSSKEETLRAISMFEHATDLDPRFAAAWSELSQGHCSLVFNGDRSPTRIAMARKALERAVALEPDVQSVWLARVSYASQCEKDYHTARTLLRESRLPGNSEVLRVYGFILRRQGLLQEAAGILQRAFRLDPKSALLAGEIAETYRAMGNDEEADRFARQEKSLLSSRPLTAASPPQGR